ncbi:chemotaxis response regulator protein-glutamate methylesterase [Xaviernesmea oryzae]|uniref:Protein-glutamate methylesterase/protein-glutamine glutaminase n=1 Tax=Xaviernesmea oryzae TaxID=464029 RepID=A0A1Q9B1E2_9HYPH|nr:chemotaxis-specific protein-glutamate methyltransferase CheB [Xaviernesmea oryzae]OLP61806.1 chemotaxis response regulator protein-glutamate methylesterase [Xaviernesmea oryzae]SEL76784.1 two-component system, chemotaxis family, response regulator CheB [Xaviernesmea oryzae]
MPLKILVVDDSALMRKHLVSLFKDEGFEVQIARTGREALIELPLFRPDVVTLDINMPEMDGLTALSHIMTEQPTPTVMVSSLTEKGALATLEALAMGAVDYIPKPGGTISLSINSIADTIVDKVKIAARARIKGQAPRQNAAPATNPPSRTPAARPSAKPAAAPAVARPSAPPVRRPAGPVTAAPIRVAPRSYATASGPFGLVLIGVSTGGPRALEEILPGLPADLPWPVVVAQHMPAAFTASFAQRLDNLCPLKVKEATSMEELRPGTVTIARGGADLTIGRRGGRLVSIIQPESPRFTWHPSVELLVSSALEVVPPRDLVAVQLTGMGHDGADAMAALKLGGGRTIAESEETAVVFGMPAELIRRDGASIVLPSGKIAGHIRQWLRRPA